MLDKLRWNASASCVIVQNALDPIGLPIAWLANITYSINPIWEIRIWKASINDWINIGLQFSNENAGVNFLKEAFGLR